MQGTVEELLQLVRARSMSTRQWAESAGVSLATIHRIGQTGARPTSNTVARLGLAAGLRLELTPLRDDLSASRRKRPPALPGELPAFAGPVAAPYLLSLVGAELRHIRRSSRGLSSSEVAQELRLSTESVLRAERPRAPWAHLAHLEALALAAGHALTWYPIDSDWRLRPWQKTAPISDDRQRALARKAGSRGALYLSLDETWRTPPELYADLAAEFPFMLDAAALSTNALCSEWLGPDHPDPTRRDALRWSNGWAEVPHDSRQSGAAFVYLNPPYGSGLGEWTSRAAATAESGVGVVALLPARTDTRWWHRDVMERAEIRFLRGRLHFGSSPMPAPFPSVVVIWRP